MSILSSQKNLGRNPGLFEFTNGVAIDSRLAKQEIRVQIGWSESLNEIGVLSANELHSVRETLLKAEKCIQEGKFDWRVEDEDIHMNLERFLVENLGELGKKVHLGRSRNDLIATTLRIFVRDSLNEVKGSLSHLIGVISKQATRLASVIVPGMTHLQHGQPIRYGHILAAVGWAFSRDLERLEFVQKQSMAYMPLGSAAMAGTTLKVNLEILASKLGFRSPTFNSYDSVGDRDFLVEGLQAFSLIATHMSRVSEDFIIASSTAVGLLKLPPAWSTGSSIMPNKRNPDVPELLRARSSHLIAGLGNANILLKGLPSGYNSDLHELKGIYLRSFDELQNCLEVLAHFISEIEIDTHQAKYLLSRGQMLATDFANALSEAGVPFREAYQQVAALVETAESQGVSIEKLDAAILKSISPRLNLERISQISFESAVEARSSTGGTSLKSVLDGILKLQSTS